MLYKSCVCQVYVDVLSEGDLHFITHSLYPDMEVDLLQNMIHFNSEVSTQALEVSVV